MGEDLGDHGRLFGAGAMISTHELDEVFNRGMQVYLKLKTHERRGRTAEECVNRSRALGDACPASEEFPYKVMIDKLVGIANMSASAVFEYDDFEIRRYIDVVQKKSDSYCVNGGLFRDDGSPAGLNERTKPDDTRSARTHELSV